MLFEYQKILIVFSVFNVLGLCLFMCLYRIAKNDDNPDLLEAFKCFFSFIRKTIELLSCDVKYFKEVIAFLIICLMLLFGGIIIITCGICFCICLVFYMCFNCIFEESESVLINNITIDVNQTTVVSPIHEVL